MSTLTLWVLILAAGIGTFLMRLSGIQLFGDRQMPAFLRKPLRFVPAAVISAIVLPAIVYGGPDPGFHIDNPRLYAGLIAALVAWTSRSVLATLGAGMVSLWLLQWLFQVIGVSA